MMTDLAAPLRRLPIPLPPVANETMPSYLRRLATVNHIEVDDLHDVVANEIRNVLARRRPVSVTRLAALTGYRVDQLDHVLPDLRHQPRPRRLQPPLPACPRCVRRHRGGPIKIYLPEHRHVCVWHNTWFGSLGPANRAWINPEGPIDVTRLPMIRTAQRRHHRLIQRHGNLAAAQAVETANAIWGRMHHPSLLGEHEWARIWLFRPATNKISQHDPLAHAVRYPDIVTIASVVISPRWQTLAASLHTRNQAFDEIGRRVGLDRYNWRPGKRHPLTYWAERCEQHLRDRRRREADHSARATSTETQQPARSQ